MRAAAFQFDVRTADVSANLATVERGLRAAADAGISLVVLPEMWPTSFPSAGETTTALSAASDRAVARVAELGRELDLVICGSAFGRRDHAGGTKPTNRLHVIDGGELVAAYDKVHLFTPTAEDESFAAGDEPPPVVETSVGKIGGVICYDLRFPELVRALFRSDAEILVVPAQWPAPRLAHWRALVAGRAVESQAFVVACNRTGRASIGRRGMELDFPESSLICDPDGRVLVQSDGTEGPGCSAESGAERLVAAEIDLELARTMRIRVPVAKDERRGLYARWALPAPGTQRLRPEG